MTDDLPKRQTLTPARAAAIAADIDEAMWLRAREGDVAAAKVVYARLADKVAPEVAGPKLPPRWEEIEALYQTIRKQQKEGHHEPRVLDDAVDVDSGKGR